nr:MAG TPA: hypothetical protein [Caudoviricetes sp.]
MARPAGFFVPGRLGQHPKAPICTSRPFKSLPGQAWSRQRSARFWAPSRCCCSPR